MNPASTPSARAFEAPRRRVALVTCADKPDHEDDDAALRAAMRAIELDFDVVAWDDPTVAWGDYGLTLIRTTWDYHHRREAFVAWAERAGALSPLHNPPEIIRWNTDKRYLATLAAVGAPLPPTVWIDQGQDIDPVDVLLREGWARGFMKPVVGANASHTARFGPGDRETAKAALQRGLQASAMMLQPYIEGVEAAGEFSGLWIDGIYRHGVQKQPAPGDWRVQDDWGATDQPYSLTDAEKDLGEAIIAEATRQRRAPIGADPRPLLYARVDFLKAADGAPLLMELELVEPSLFLRHGPETAAALAAAIEARLPAR